MITLNKIPVKITNGFQLGFQGKENWEKPSKYFKKAEITSVNDDYIKHSCIKKEIVLVGSMIDLSIDNGIYNRNQIKTQKLPAFKDGSTGEQFFRARLNLHKDLKEKGLDLDATKERTDELHVSEECSRDSFSCSTNYWKGLFAASKGKEPSTDMQPHKLHEHIKSIYSGELNRPTNKDQSPLNNIPYYNGDDDGFNNDDFDIFNYEPKQKKRINAEQQEYSANNLNNEETLTEDGE